VRAEAREILIDIGAKSEGVVDEKELEKMSADAIKKLRVGDTVLRSSSAWKTVKATSCSRSRAHRSNTIGAMRRVAQVR